MNNKKINFSKVFFVFLLLAYFVLTWGLYHNQLLTDVTGLFESDTAVHVRFAVEDRFFYSLSSYVYFILDLLPGTEYTISLLLALMTVGSILLTVVLLEKVSEKLELKVPDTVKYTIAFFANFVMAFYVKKANQRHYIGYQSANMWHNSTYIFMRFFALLTIIVFLNIFEKYREGMTLKEWFMFTFLLTITTAFKASFLTVFAPTLAIMLLIDFLGRKTSFLNACKLGSAVFLPIAVLFLENAALSGIEGETGYAIKPFAALAQRGDHPKVTLVLSVLFPLMVAFYHIKDFWKEKLYFGSLIMWAVGFLEVFLFIETGERALDGNFMWGYSISLFFLFFMSMMMLARDLQKIFSVKGAILRKIVLSGITAVLLWHFISGVVYFAMLLSGVTYFV